MVSFVPVLQAAVLIVLSWLGQLHQQGAARVEGVADTNSTAACCLCTKAVMSSCHERALLDLWGQSLLEHLVIESYVTG